MTLDEIRSRLAEIRAEDDDRDYEGAHALEDELFQDVLRAIAAGACDDPAACAAEALKSLENDFERWCA
jgi:hypothetical protein